MAIDVYRGVYVNAERATDYIDQDTIVSGCKMMNEAAERMDQITKNIELLKDLCTKDDLSVRGLDLNDIIEDFENHTNEISLYISDLSGTIVSSTQRIVNRKQVILNEEAKRQDRVQINLHNNSTN